MSDLGRWDDVGWLHDEIERLQARVDELGGALTDLFAMIDEGLLVRDISKDDDPLWALAALDLTRRLAKAYKALEGEWICEKN